MWKRYKFCKLIVKTNHYNNRSGLLLYTTKNIFLHLTCNIPNTSNIFCVKFLCTALTYITIEAKLVYQTSKQWSYNKACASEVKCNHHSHKTTIKMHFFVQQIGNTKCIKKERKYRRFTLFWSLDIGIARFLKLKKNIINKKVWNNLSFL